MDEPTPGRSGGRSFLDSIRHSQRFTLAIACTESRGWREEIRLGIDSLAPMAEYLEVDSMSVPGFDDECRVGLLDRVVAGGFPAGDILSMREEYSG